MSFRRIFVRHALALAVMSTAGLAHAEGAADAHAPLFGDAKAGEGKVAVCGACHGVDGNPSVNQYPKLAGQNEAYIARQITLFQTQKRANAIMMGFAASLSQQDMHDIGAYFATKSSAPGVADDKLLERGQALYRGGDAKLGVPACMACHGPDGRGIAGTGFPQLAGQWTDYVTAKLKDWKSGTTWGDDAKAKIMPTIAQTLSDADIAAVASYIEGLHTAATGTPVAAK
ncbi:MAG: c-type cytochrome [Dokdonella sp.]|uniref:c-type cytochrome n=1 Tax=Dokdonella sp. TaxID=2291710 RepID=UPI003266307B